MNAIPNGPTLGYKKEGENTLKQRSSRLGEEMPGYILKNTEGDCAALHVINYTQSSARDINATQSVCTYLTSTAQTLYDPDTALLSQCKHRS